MLRLTLAMLLFLALPGTVPAWTLHVAAYDVSGSTALAKLLARGVAAANREVLNGHNFSLAVLPLNIETVNNSRNSIHIAVNQLCSALEQRRILALLLVGATPAAVSMALAAGAAGLPLLWARNATYTIIQQGTSRLEVSLEPHATEIALALRALIRSAPWPAFSIVSGEGEMWSTVRAAMAQNDLEVAGSLPWQRAHSRRNRRRKEAPVPASIHLLRTGTRHEDISKTLAELRRVPRGLVVLMLDPPVAKMVLEEAAAMRMLNSHWVFMLVDAHNASLGSDWPPGLMTLKPRPAALTTKHATRGLLRMLARLVVHAENKGWLRYESKPTCWRTPTWRQAHFAANVVRWVQSEVNIILGGRSRDTDVAPLAGEFEVMNLAKPPTAKKLGWRRVGYIRGSNVSLETITWPGGGFLGAGVGSRGGKPEFRVVTVPAPPFVMVGSSEGNTCVRGVRCMREEGPACCFGYSMDLLQQLAEDLNFQYHVYVVKDGLHGNRLWRNNGSWSGAIGEIASGRAHLAIAALSITSTRSKVVDYSTPYFYSSVSMLAAPPRKNNIPLLAFLLPFSIELWVAIFTSLNVTAIAVAIYEWLSPFGLNPWGRQRTRNFSIASALWVMWGLLCGHLVAFKAPKSWPNKFLINVWGGFSVIFVASYTANIAALIAGDFFQNQAALTDLNLKTHSVGVTRATAAEFYVQGSNPELFQHTRHHQISDIMDGVQALRNGTLDVLIGDSPVLDYFRGMDPGCKLRKLGDIMHHDMYAIAMSKGFPMQEIISDTVDSYARSGMLDMLQARWWGGLPCFTPESELVQPHPLGVTAVAGVFLLLLLGMVAGLLILMIEHAFYKSVLPSLREKPKGSVWRSRNVMFFSQKLYRFINNVQLVSPHHAARELLHTLKKGHITSLFQKSVKRKEHEQRRRRKSKAQFFNMIQEIRRVQAEERDMTLTTTTTSLTSPQSDEGPPQSPLLLEKRIIAQMHLAQLAAESPAGTPIQIQEISTFPRAFDKRPYEKNAITHAQNDKNAFAQSEFERNATVHDGIGMRRRVRTNESFEQRVPSFYEGRLRRSSAARLASQGSLDAIDIPLSPVNRAPPIRTRETQTLPRNTREAPEIPQRSMGTQCQSMEVPLSPRTLPHTRSRDAQWQARENELRQQLIQILREKQALQDRMRILEMCIKPP